MLVTYRSFYYWTPLCLVRTVDLQYCSAIVSPLLRQLPPQRHTRTVPARNTATNFQLFGHSTSIYRMTSNINHHHNHHHDDPNTNRIPNRKRNVKLLHQRMDASTSSSAVDQHDTSTTTTTLPTTISLQRQRQSFMTSILHHFTNQSNDDVRHELLTQVQHRLIQFWKDYDSSEPMVSPLSLPEFLLPEAVVPLSIFPNSDHTDANNNNNKEKEHLEIEASISHLIQQIHRIFCDMACTSTSKETRIKLRHLAAMLLLPPHLSATPSVTVTTTPLLVPSTKNDESTNPITTSLFTLSLILTSLSLQTNNASIEQQLQQQVCRAAASAICAAMEDFLQTNSNFIIANHPLGVMTLRHLVLSLLVVHRHIVTTTTIIITNTSTTTSTVPEMATPHDSTMHIDFHIITNLARLLGMENCYCCGTSITSNANNHNSIKDADDSLLSDVVTFVITNGLQLSYDANSISNKCDGNQMINGETNSISSNIGTDDGPTYETDVIRPENVITNDIDTLTTMISFASQFRPWHRIDPIPLIHIAMDHLLWHSAEKICTSVTTGDPDVLKYATQMGIDAVSTYVDITIQRRAHRQADKIATTFFDVFAVGIHDNLLERYFLNARYLHACNTIVKLIRKRAIPVIERQVERIDQSVLKIKENREHKIRNNDVCSLALSVKNVTEPFYEGGTTLECASMDVRNFALQKLEESGDMDSALRFATVWEMDYVMNPEVMKLAEQRRKQLYIQWEDLFPHQPNVPDLITTPEALDHAMMIQLGSNHTVYGFDVEWGNDDDTGIVGAALLQIATIDNVILVDIPSLSKTTLGVEALERHINALFHNPNIDLVGFSCREDLSKLKNSPCIRKERHWFHSDHVAGSSHIVIDLQSMIARLNIDQLPKDHFGLSKVCEYYLMKPLDKSEQCSEWNQRPLTMKQRIYAALDAYVCAIVYTKMMNADHSTEVATTSTATTDTMYE